MENFNIGCQVRFPNLQLSELGLTVIHVTVDCPSPSQGVLKVDVNQDSAGDAPLLRRRRAATHLPTPSPFVSDRAPSSQARQRKRQSLRCIKDQSIIRAKYRVTGEVLDNLYPHTPILEIVTPLGVICANWDEMERQIGRRLVRFRKIQDGRRIILSCEVIKQEDYRETNIVISCIYREESEKSFVTSVDIIYLLERLTDDEFPVEEKNRIRRNLEGLRPTTVSKHKGGSEAFFLRIMEFPDPKPRNIEKDLKVFEWTQLGHALEKILSKYVSCEDAWSVLPITHSRNPPVDIHIISVCVHGFASKRIFAKQSTSCQHRTSPAPKLYQSGKRSYLR